MEDKGNKDKKCSSSAEKDEINEVENNSSTELGDLAKQIQSKIDIRKYDTWNPIVYCVDPFLFEVNPAAWIPKFISIGPRRCYDTILLDYERQKLKYLNSFLDRPETKASLNDFCKLIEKSENQIQCCYDETYVRNWKLPGEIQQNKQANDGDFKLFKEMVLVDACFIIELFLKAYKSEEEETDFNLHTPRKKHDIGRDLFLAQHQLPFFILKDIYERAFGGDSAYPSFLHLTCHFFSPYYNQNISIDDIFSQNPCHDEYRTKLEAAKHFTDLLRTLQQSNSFQKGSSNEKSFFCKPHIEWIKNKLFKKSEESLEADEAQGEYLYSAVLLREAGVKFKVSTSRCLLDIEFDHRKGEFRIPPLRVDESTEPFFRNLIAWEQRYYSHDTYISDYMFLMEYLIKSTEDVDLLVRRRILINQLGSNTAVVTLFNNSCKNVLKVEKNRHSDLFRKLDAYNAVRHHSWIAILRLQYFSTLWRGVATIAAVVLLVLTLIQTICAVISL